MFRFASELQPDDAVEACEEAVDVLKEGGGDGSLEVSFISCTDNNDLGSKNRPDCPTYITFLPVTLSLSSSDVVDDQD